MPAQKEDQTRAQTQWREKERPRLNDLGLPFEEKKYPF
jgi:hypothetical protein